MYEKKVLILVNHEIVIYNFRKEFILRLLKRGIKVYISSPNGKKIKELELLGCIHVDTEIDRRGVNPIKDFKLLVHYWEIFKKIKPDIVFSYTIKPNVYGGLVTRFFKIPFVPTVTGLGSAIKNKSIIQKIVNNLYRTSFKKAQRIFFQNKENLNYFKNYKIVSANQDELVAGSGVNLASFKYQSYPKKEKTTNLIFIGRLMKDKGVIELFKAAKYFKNSAQKINFHILGFFEDDLEETVQKLNNDGIINYHGQQSDIRPLLKESHAIVHPSYHEGLSNVLLEAAASGRPIIASDIPGCRETFEEGVTGFGFEAKSTESLIRAIENFLQLSHEAKEKMGILGREKIEREYDRKRVVDAYLNEINV